MRIEAHSVTLARRKDEHLICADSLVSDLTILQALHYETPLKSDINLGAPRVIARLGRFLCVLRQN